MISRRENNFQDKKRMVTFGQLILPLTFVIALGLLFFSIKLFFYTPLNPANNSIIEEEDKQIAQTIRNRKAETIAKEEPASQKAENPSLEKQPAKRTETTEEHVAIVSARPVEKTSKTQTKTAEETAKVDKPAEKQHHSQDKTAERPENGTEKADVQKRSAKAVAKTEDKSRQKNAATEANNNTQQTQQEVQGKGKRWDVQIGGFADKERALAIMKKAVAEGYKVYLTESRSGDAPFYRIRVKGSKNKKTAENLSLELAGKKYPVYLIQIE